MHERVHGWIASCDAKVDNLLSQGKALDSTGVYSVRIGDGQPWTTVVLWVVLIYGQLLSILGVVPAKVNNRVIESIRRCITQDMTLDEIAVKHGVSKKTVQRYTAPMVVGPTLQDIDPTDRQPSPAEVAMPQTELARKKIDVAESITTICRMMAAGEWSPLSIIELAREWKLRRYTCRWLPRSA